MKILKGVLFALIMLSGVLTGAPAWANNCLDFDGVNDYAAGTGVSTSLTSITLEAWVYPRTLPDNKVSRFVTVADEVAVLRYDGSASGGPGQLHFYIKASGTLRHVRVNNVLQSDAWQHVAGTYDGTAMRLYLNGDLIGSNTVSTALTAPDGSVRLSHSSETLNGYIDKIRLWSSARTQEEIQGKMHRTLAGNETGLVNYWKLDEASGTTAVDSAGTADLTLYNGMGDANWSASGAPVGLHVDHTATGADNGSSWTDAFTDLQTALAAAVSGDTIRVAQGVYKPATGSDRNATFQLKNGVTLYGGYPDGGGTRDPETYVTTLSGDIGTVGNNSDNSCHVVTGSGTNNSAVLDGFTITGGNATGGGGTGGGMYNNNGSPSLANLTFSNNTAGGTYSAQGGGMYNYQANPKLTNVTFSSNSVSVSNATGGGSANGGGMMNRYCSPTLTNVTFSDNTAGAAGSSYAYGGGMYNDNSNPALTNVTFGSNAAGGSNGAGGGIYNSNSNPTLKNVTFGGNSATYRGGGIYDYSSSPTIRNTILWGNTASQGAQIYNYSSSPAVSYSVVQGGCPTGSTCTNLITANPNLDALTDFGGAGKQVFPLQSGSSAIDTGDNGNCPATDQRGVSRPQDGDGDGNAVCDIGAVEFTSAFIVTPSAGSNGSISPDTQQSVDYNGTAVFTIKPAIGYHVITPVGGACGGSYTGDPYDSINGITYTTSAVTGNCTVEPSFAVNITQYTVTPSAGAGGTISPDTPQTVNENDTMSFTITPDPGYFVDAIGGTCGGTYTGDPYDSINGITYTTSAVTGNCTVEPSFAVNITQYTITPSAGAGGTISPDTPQTVNENDTVSFTITPDPGYSVDAIGGTCGGTYTGDPYDSINGITYTTNAVTGNCTVEASFAVNITQYTVTPSAGAGGTIDPDTPQMVNEDDTVSFTITPDPGYAIDSVGGTCGGALSGNTYTTNAVTGDCTVDVAFIQIFAEPAGASLTGVFASSAAWGDYDNDGNLDILLTGRDNNEEAVSKIYHNNGDGTFTEQTGIALTGVFVSSVAWGDYDSDGYLDILLTGGDNNIEAIAKIYRNNGDGTFTEQNGIALTGVYGGSAVWGDYNNDGRLDILLTGYAAGPEPVSRLYLNNGSGGFTDAGITLTGVGLGSTAWGDYDNDGRLDILLTGIDGSDNPVSKIYRNNQDRSFTDSGISLPGVAGGSAAWGDYDNNGNSISCSQGKTIQSRLYQKSTGITHPRRTTRPPRPPICGQP